MRLSAAPDELRELFGIDLVPHEPFVFPAMRDRWRWTVEDTEWLELLYVSGISIALIALILGHSKQTVSQWVGALRLYRLR